MPTVTSRVIVPELHIDTSVKIDGAFTPSDGTVTNAKLVTSPEIKRSQLAQETVVYPIPLTSWRQWDEVNQIVGTAAADDLAITGTFSSEAPHITAGDIKAAGSNTRYARAYVNVPVEYDSGESLSIRVYAGMQTAIADISCTVDIEAWKNELDVTVGTSDLCSTSAQNMNSLVYDRYDFTITPTGLAAGDLLDVRLSVVYEDQGSTSTVEPTITATELVCVIQG